MKTEHWDGPLMVDCSIEHRRSNTIHLRTPVQGEILLWRISVVFKAILILSLDNTVVKKKWLKLGLLHLFL